MIGDLNKERNALVSSIDACLDEPTVIRDKV